MQETESNAPSPEAPQPVLSVKSVSYSFGPKRALDDVSFDILPGRFTALLGLNGAGKTTLFSLITRLFDAPQGEITIAGASLSQAGSAALHPLGIVFQQSTLDLDLTVRQNLLYFGALRGFSRRETTSRMMPALTSLDMVERVDEKVRALNGGHRRRVEIARAILHDPQLLLLDEATVGLDPTTRRVIVEHIHDLAAQNNVAVLWATHLIDEIAPTDDLIVLHQGRIVVSGRAADVVASTSADGLEQAFEQLVQSGASPS